MNGERIEDLIEDVNVNEIMDHVNCGTLKEWLDIWRSEMHKALSGKWIYKPPKPNARFFSDTKVCSRCGEEAYWDSDYGQQLFDFCPYCGAKMEGKA